MLAEKEMLLDEIKERISPGLGFILTKYQNMDANAFAEFREILLKSGGDFFIMKKRVFIKAAKDLNLEYNKDELDGHLGVISVKNNFVATTKALYAYKSERENVIDVLGGHFEGVKCTVDDVEQISKLPSQNEMRAAFLGVLEAPMANMLGVVEAIMTSVINCMDNKAKKEM